MPRETNLLSLRCNSRCGAAARCIISSRSARPAGVIYCGVMPPAGLRYRSQIGRRVPDGDTTSERLFICFTRPFSSLLPRPARTSGKEREVTNGEAEINCLSAVCLESWACKAQFLRGRFVSRRTGISCARIAGSLAKDLRVIIAGTAQCCRAPGNDGKNVYFISRFFQDTVVRMVVNQQMSATLYNYRWLDITFTVKYLLIYFSKLTQ